jgi:hypothetical protein
VVRNHHDPVCKPLGSRRLSDALLRQAAALSLGSRSDPVKASKLRSISDLEPGMGETDGSDCRRADHREPAAEPYHFSH